MVMFLRNVNGSSSFMLTGYLDQQKHETQKIKQIETMRKNQTNKLQI